MALLNMINKMDTSEAPCSRKAKRQQKVEIQQDAFDIDDDEEIPIITEETEEELAAFEAVNRPRTTSGKIRVTEEDRPETAASLKYRPKSGRSTFDSRPTTAVTLKTKSRTVSRASSRKSRAESGFSRQDRGQYYDSDSDEEPRSPTKRDLFLEAELSNVDSILADDKAFDTDLEVEEIEDLIENLYPINIGETTTTYDRKTDYINDCKKNGIVPASYFLRHMEKPQLTMSHHGLGEEGMKCIARSLASNTTVLNLDISDNWLGDTGGLIVCNMLKENIYITDLTLRDNRLGFGCAEQIGEVMKTNSTLTHLTLSGNQFDDKSAIFFADAITTSKLEYLNLSHNRFGEIAGLLLGPAIAENTTMKELDISWNNIRRKGAMALGQGIKNNDFMKKMNVSWNGFGVEGAISLCDALKHNQVLEEINIMNCRLTTEAAVLIGKGLSVNENTALKVIKLGKNPMQSAGCYGICAAILRNPNCVLEEIDFEDVLVNKDFEEVFKQVKEQLPNIKMKHGGMEPPQKPKAKIHPMVKLMNYIEKNNLKLIDFFSQLDKDGSMCISYEEFEQGLEENGIKLTKEEIELLLEELDSDGDGDINFSELATGHTEFKERTDNINTILTASQPRPLTT
ncbi:leucine-rich repeat-containing protein 74B-like isoform X1 [Mytilus californianus]|uniref:leucine-rich repeat-containing protein 74B-like isoform X1 n=1 Tax=Mytilus californianus TaxID=6549 RepID=UPI002248137A|nr:leucine-rich repeat-containing protein 74B-like isoform X1 [Mytilus californianus]